MKSELQEGRDLIPKWVCVVWRGRERANHTGWREGKTSLPRQARLNDTSEQSRQSCVTDILCVVAEQEGGFRFLSAALGLSRGRPWQASGDRSCSMGHNASSETVAEQPVQHNTGEFETRGSPLDDCERIFWPVLNRIQLVCCVFTCFDAYKARQCIYKQVFYKRIGTGRQQAQTGGKKKHVEGMWWLWNVQPTQASLCLRTVLHLSVDTSLKNKIWWYKAPPDTHSSPPHTNLFPPLNWNYFASYLKVIICWG